MGRYIIAGNWKLNKTPSEAGELAKALTEQTVGAGCEVVIAPSHVALARVAEVIRGSRIKLAAQNVSQHSEGAYTGETSVSMLKDLGVEYVILGHSERRQYYGETNQIINAKIKAVLAGGLKPILCIGELLEEREEGKAATVCRTQLEQSLAGISAADMAEIVIAYEPVWAIGTGKTASPEDANEIHVICREKLASLYSEELAGRVVIQYGGSVKPDNVRALMAKSDINGALVGGASLDAASFASLLRF
ncbi:triose-phosphate isomerase [Candidatus Haliotispira prima]|uniref:Triosephosphate isomerase n=1 Tax=Candidatus Haliotispira prima TaxID=3034016 RepID=A0ABY8MHY6_9SPIO|nr:triose-phosphate isomerase [Candidatus Haliotispira prima]